MVSKQGCRRKKTQRPVGDGRRWEKRHSTVRREREMKLLMCNYIRKHKTHKMPKILRNVKHPNYLWKCYCSISMLFQYMENLQGKSTWCICEWNNCNSFHYYMQLGEILVSWSALRTLLCDCVFDNLNFMYLHFNN